MEHPLTSDKLRAGRALLGLTQGDLAAKAGVGVATVSGYERGKYSPHRATLDSLLRCLTESGVVLTANGVEKSC